MDASFVPKLAKKARLRFDRHAQKHMIMYPERGLVLNDSAAAIAKLCDGQLTVGQIIDALSRDAGREVADQIIADVHAFLEDLQKKGLLE